MNLLRRSAAAVRRLVAPRPAHPPDFAPAEIETLRAVAPYTMTSPERLIGLVRAVAYLVENKIAGDIVECGVWKGGSMMAVARTLLRLGDTTRHLWLFDTFAGMTPPTAADVALDGQSAARLLQADPSIRCEAALDGVKRVTIGTGYPETALHFIPGRVEETIPAHAPRQIALLRLDTDWYESTRHELEHLFPRLVRGGVLVIDDYGHWQGARKAVDEYFRTQQIAILLNRLDYTGRIAVKL